MGLNNDRRIYDMKNEANFTSKVNDKFKEYFSNTYYLEMDEDKRKKLFRKLILIVLSMFALALAGGLVRFDGIMHNTVLIIVYVLEILMMMSLANGLFTLNSHYNNMIESELKKSVNAFPTYTIILMVFCTISFLGSILYVIINGFHNDVLYFIVYLLIKVAIGLLSYYFRFLTINLKFNDNYNNY